MRLPTIVKIPLAYWKWAVYSPLRRRDTNFRRKIEIFFLCSWFFLPVHVFSLLWWSLRLIWWSTKNTFPNVKPNAYCHQIRSLMPISILRIEVLKIGRKKRMANGRHQPISRVVNFLEQYITLSKRIYGRWIIMVIRCRRMVEIPNRTALV